MSEAFIVYGSWKIRHTEPLTGNERSLRLVPLPAGLDIATHSLHENLAALVDPRAARRLDPDGTERAEPAKALPNLFGDDIALAVVEKAKRGWVLHHRLTRIDPHLVHLIRVGKAQPLIGPLVDALQSAFDRDHLRLNNWECLYIKGLPDTELEQKFEIDQSYEYFTLCRAWWRRLDDREIPGFVPQLGDEIQYWSYDNHFFEIDANPNDDKGYVSIMQYCKRKNQWDDPMFTFKKKVFNEDKLERWERNYENQWLAKSPQEALTEFFGYPLKPLPQWRRTRLDLACEATASGNLFMVNFDDCRIHEASGPDGRLQQCEVEYLKTRGDPDPDLIYRDFETLLGHVETFMTEQGLTFRRCHYSKLTFLKDFASGRRRTALAQAGR